MEKGIIGIVGNGRESNEERLKSPIGARRDERLLERVMACREALRAFREERERCKRFTYGDQWKDYIEDNGIRMSEEEYIRSQGNMPLKNNLIRRLVRNVLGVFRNRWTPPRVDTRRDACGMDAEEMNDLLRRHAADNRLEELYARTMEEFLISGMAVHKKWFGVRQGRRGCWTDLVSPGAFFIDMSGRDFRGHDISIVGEVHDMRFEDLCATFAHSPEDILRLSEMYGVGTEGGGQEICGVYEVWVRRRPMRLSCHDRESGRWYRLDADRKREVDAENMSRRRSGRPEIFTEWVTADEWRYEFLTPDGLVITEGTSPYRHGAHPYLFKAYPYIDGEIHSFVSDIIDQQKLTNRLISMYDWILRASAKGVLLFPEGALPDGVDINDIADEWGRFNGVIVYRPRAGVPLPQQVSSNSTDIGITQLLEIQMKMMEDISGVNGALQGKLDSNSMSGTLYNQQTQNSLTALADLLKSFDDFIASATAMDVSNIVQFTTA